MVVLAIDDRHLNVAIRKSHGGIETAKTATDNYDSRQGILTFIFHGYWISRPAEK